MSDYAEEMKELEARYKKSRLLGGIKKKKNKLLQLRKQKDAYLYIYNQNVDRLNKEILKMKKELRDMHADHIETGFSPEQISRILE